MGRVVSSYSNDVAVDNTTGRVSILVLHNAGRLKILVCHSVVHFNILVLHNVAIINTHVLHNVVHSTNRMLHNVVHLRFGSLVCVLRIFVFSILLYTCILTIVGIHQVCNSQQIFLGPRKLSTSCRAFHNGPGSVES